MYQTYDIILLGLRRNKDKVYVPQNIKRVFPGVGNILCWLPAFFSFSRKKKNSNDFLVLGVSKAVVMW